MAHKKGQGSTRNGRDSHSQRLGVKRYGGQLVPAGSILDFLNTHCFTSSNASAAISRSRS